MMQLLKSAILCLSCLISKQSVLKPASPGNSGDRVVKLLACGARGPGFDSPPRHLDFQRLVISCFQVEI